MRFKKPKPISERAIIEQHQKELKSVDALERAVSEFFRPRGVVRRSGESSRDYAARGLEMTRSTFNEITKFFRSGPAPAAEECDRVAAELCELHGLTAEQLSDACDLFKAIGEEASKVCPPR